MVLLLNYELNMKQGHHWLSLYHVIRKGEIKDPGKKIPCLKQQME